MSVTLFFGHATSNLGDVALNTGAERLVELAGATIDAAAFPPVGPSRFRRGVESFQALAHPIATYADSMSDDALIEYAEHPERFFRHYNLESTETVLIHSGEHFFAPDDPRVLHPLALWRLLPALAGKATGRRVVMLPSTFGPFSDRVLGDLYLGALGIVDGVAARDAESAHIVERAVGLTLTPLLDPAFFVGTTTEPTGSLGRAAIAMRLEGTGLRAGTARSEDVLQAAVDTGYRESTAWQLTTGIAAGLIGAAHAPEVDLIAQARADDDVTARAFESLRDAGERRVGHIRAHDLDVRAYVDRLSGYDVMVSSRFHACVLSLSQGVPAVGIALEGHGHKIPGLFALLGAPEFSFAVDGSTAIWPVVDRIVQRSSETDRFQPVWARVDALKARTVEWLGDSLAGEVVDRRDAARSLLRLLASVVRDRRAREDASRGR